MKFKIVTGDITGIKSNCLVLGVFSDQNMGPIANAIDRATEGWLKTQIERGNLDCKLKQTLLLPEVPARLACDRILLVGCGKIDDFNRTLYNKVAISALSVLNDQRITAATWALHQPLPQNFDAYTCIWELGI
ncbi:hypothetical protein TI04_13135 [Achromatium sp. WMS2]|nr:hypothetical protein TI04_13135 [Achromatium sp. WMS2]